MVRLEATREERGDLATTREPVATASGPIVAGWSVLEGRVDRGSGSGGEVGHIHLPHPWRGIFRFPQRLLHGSLLCRDAHGAQGPGKERIV